MSSSSEFFKRKERFKLPSENAVFDNTPGPVETVFIRSIHWLSLLMIRWHGFNSWNPIVLFISFILYLIDGAWSGLDREYFVKRRALYGDTFATVMSINISKLDASARAPDSLDARLTTIPQRRGFFLGATLVNRAHVPISTDKKRSLSLLHLSDSSVEYKGQKPWLNSHDQYRSTVMANFIGGDKRREAMARQKSEVAAKLLSDAAAALEGKKDKTEAYDVVASFLIRYYQHVLFGIPPEAAREDLLNAAFFAGTRYVFYLYGPNWLWSWVLYPVFCWHSLAKTLKEVKAHWAKSSPVLKDFDGAAQDGQAKGKPLKHAPVSLEEFTDQLEMLVGIAALQGTLALALNCLYQMPEGFADSHATDEAEIRAAVLECARLDTPVTGSHCIVNDAGGLNVTIGGTKYTVPVGTTLFLSCTLANTDPKRFPEPYVFNPSRTGRAPDELLSFHAVGETTNPAHPRICPGREIAQQCVIDLVRAVAARRAGRAFTPTVAPQPERAAKGKRGANARGSRSNVRTQQMH